MNNRVNRIEKIIIYIDYFIEYLVYGDVSSIISSLKYILFGSVPKRDRIVRSRLGKYRCRALTNDFQYVNFAHEKLIKKFILQKSDWLTHFIDIGSCMGEYCVWLAPMGVKCIAFEPVEDNYINFNSIIN